MNDATIKSDVAGVSWPGVPASMAAQWHSVLFQMESSQWWPEARLREHQDRQLQTLLTHAYETVPEYRRRLDAAAINPVQGWSDNQWEKIPILTRKQLQSLGPALHSTAIPDSHQPVQVVRTSGSTGTPVSGLSTAVTRFFWNVITLREHLWQRRDFSRRLGSIRPDRTLGADGSAAWGHWGTPAGELFATGPSFSLHSSADIDHQLRWIEEQQPAYLLSLPSNLMELALACRDRKISFPWLQQLRSFGETVKPALRALCSEVWDAPLLDIYSASEAGYVALQCPEHEHYHVQSETMRVEVLNENGQACAPGEIGRVVVTALHNFAMPLIRYQIMDYAEVGSPCPCGRGLAVLKRILGRERNMAVTPEGKRFWPSFPAEDWMHIAPIRQIQLLQRSPGKITVRLVVERMLSGIEQRTLTEVLQASLNYPFDISLEYCNDIRNPVNGKYEDFVSDLTDTG